MLLKGEMEMPSDKDKIELHREMLTLLKLFDEICHRNNIHYSLHGGTLLGAIREKGFIAWDDDLDISMTKVDYVKYCNIMCKGDIGDDIIFDEFGTPPRVWLKRKNKISVWIDLLIYDYISENFWARKIKYLILVFFLGFTKTQEGMKITSVGEYKGIKYMFIYILYSIGRLFPHKWKMNLRYKFTESCFVGNKKYMVRLNDQYKALHIVVSSEAVNSYIRVPFEDSKFMIHAGYDEILRTSYGEDYMTPVKPEAFHKNTHCMARGLEK